MSITIDDAKLDANGLGLSTVGEVLSHVARGNRLVVQLLIDGSEPDLGRMDVVRQRRLGDCTLFIETVQPQAICREVLEAVDDQIGTADVQREAAASLFREGKASEGMQKLAACFGTWQHAQDSLGKVAQLLRADLGRVMTASGESVESIIASFRDNLRGLKEALEARDHTLCCDVLTYDMERTAHAWRDATAALRRVCGS